MDEYGDFRSRQQQTVWHSLNRLLVALIAFTFVTLIACAFVPLLKDVREGSAREMDLRAELQKERVLVAEHMREVELLKNDPPYLETIARDRLDMMKDGETVYRIDAAPKGEQGHGRATP